MENTTYTSEPTIITVEQANIIQVLNYVVMSSFMATFGIIANVINIVIFFKQGLTNTVNMSLFGIAISDLLGLMSLQWLCICLNPWFQELDLSFNPKEIQYLTGGVFNVAFSRVTGWITAFVTLERCLCVTVPLKVKQIITPKRTAISLIVIYIVNIFAHAPDYFIMPFTWKFYEKRNATILGLIYTESEGPVASMLFLFTAFLGFSSFVTVIALTAILVYQLKKKSKWRRSVTCDTSNSAAISGRDKKTMQMIVTISCVLIICYTPGVIVAMVSFFEPKFKTLGPYFNLFLAVWSFPLMFNSVNSSINIIFYYRMSTSYRQTFNQIFSCVLPKTSGKRDG